MAYNLAVQCSHQGNVFSIHPQMSTKEIFELIASHFGIPADSFELEVYDDQSQRYIDFDDEYVEELRQTSPRTHKKTVNAQVLFQETRKTDLVASLYDAPSPSYVPANSPGSKSVSEDLQPTTPNIDFNLCLYQNSSPPPSHVQSHSDDNSESNSHVVFVRDVTLYQRTQYRRQINENDTRNTGTIKKNYIIRIQGVKTDSDAKYASILPEIKFPSIFLQQGRLMLIVAIVIEERNEERVYWRLDTVKGFLPDDAETDKMYRNPIQLSIDRSTLSNDGIYKLPLRMCTVSQAEVVTPGSIFHTLSLSNVQQLHSAEYVANTPRLACVIVNRHGIIDWDTFGLSNFMCPKWYAKPKGEEWNSNNDQCTERQEKKSHKSTSRCTTSTHVTTFDLPNKHRRLMNEFIIAWFGLQCSEMHGSTLEIGLTDYPVILFHQLKSLIEFLYRDQDQQVVLILSNFIDEIHMSLIHSSPKLHSIYIVGKNNDEIEEWSKKWKKISGIFNGINVICHELKQITRNIQHNIKPTTIKYDSSSNNFDALTTSFIFKQMLKEKLIQIQFNEKTKDDLFSLVHYEHGINDLLSHVIDEFKQDYDSSSTIWWYTRDAYLYSMLNRALRLQSTDIIIQMRYLMRDIHNRYNRIHFLVTNNNHRLINSDISKLTWTTADQLSIISKQKQTNSNKLAFETASLYNLYQQIKGLDLKADEIIPMTVYRGQALSRSNFEQLLQNRNGLLSFNNFLSTTTNRDVSLLFAESAQSNPDLIGILFEIKLEKSILSTPIVPLTCLNDIDAYFINEEDILLSMHTVFRIKSIDRVDIRLWQVELMFSVDDDKIYKTQIRQDMQKISKGSTKLLKLGSLLINMGEFEKAEEIYKTLSETEYHTNREEIAYLYSQLGCINNDKRDFNSALSYYQKSLTIQSNILPHNNSELAQLFNNIGMVYKSTGYCSIGMSYLQRALDSYQKIVTLEYSNLVMIYNNIGHMYSSREEYTIALLYFHKAIEIQQRFHVSSYPFLAIIYVNISQVYHMLGDILNALVLLRKALVIYQQKSSFILPELIEIYYIIDLLKNTNRTHMTTLTNFPKVLQSQHMYLPLIYAQIDNNDRFIVKQGVTNMEKRYIYKNQQKRKFDLNNFVAMTSEITVMNSCKNAYKTSEKKRKHTKECVPEISVATLVNDMDVLCLDKIHFSTKKSKDQSKNYLKLPFNGKLPMSLIHMYRSVIINSCITMNCKAPQISSTYSYLRTGNLFNLNYPNNEASKNLDQWLLAAIRTSPSSCTPYHFIGTCYRAVNLSFDKLEEYKTGKLVLTRSFVSTLKDETLAKHFIPINNNKNQLVMWKFQMKNPQSSLCIDKLSEYSIEKEVLILPHTVFRITKGTDVRVHVNGQSDSIKLIQLEECDLNLI